MPEIEEVKQTEEKRPAAPVIPFTKNELREMLGKGTLAGDTLEAKAARITLVKDVFFPQRKPLTYSQAVNGLQTFKNFETCAVRCGRNATLDAFKENNLEVSSSTPAP